VGRASGVTEAKLRALDDFETSAALSEVEKLVLRYATGMTETPAKVSDEVFEGLRRHFDPGQLVELTSAIAWENHRARFNRAFEIESDGFSEGSYCPLPLTATTRESVGRRG
jgi:alkylhydroperoxidase family enzyme